MEGEEELKPKFALPVKITLVSKEQVELSLPNDVKISWPANLLPEDHNSEIAYLELITPQVLEGRKKRLAREVLLKILNIGREN